MIFNDSIFQALCFFTLGFLCLNALISLVLNYHFRNKAYSYYLGYVLLAICFVFTVMIMQEKSEDPNGNQNRIISIVYDVLRVVIFYFHSLFMYKSMVIENKKIEKLSWLMNIYTFIVFFRILIAVLNPDFMDNNPFLMGVSRVLIISISCVFIYFLYKEYSNVYLRFLFFASLLLIFFVLLSMFDSLLNDQNTTLRGFMFFCIGIVLENICFIFIFIYKIITIDREKKNLELTHKEQLNSVKFEMQQMTMQNIGREIHDNVGQKLTLASLYTQQLDYENKAPLITKTIESISELINQSLSELRQLSKSLTSDTIDCNSFAELLKLECDRFKGLKNCNITFADNSEIHLLGYQSKSILLRITQEFIQNSIKHSNCKNITITLNNSIKNINLSLEDDGEGFDVNRKTTNGIGLINIKNRLQIIGGTYTLQSQLNIGTKLTLEIPL